jgi:DNA-damage-inducible protein D
MRKFYPDEVYVMKKLKNNTILEGLGLMGLYGGLSANEIKARKGLKPDQNLFASMGYTELAANYFRITQTEEKLKREGLSGKIKDKHLYFEVGRRVRQTIMELGNPMPEDLPIKSN